MSNELAQKQLPSVLERFKALLKQREDEVRVFGGGGDDDDDEYIVQLYMVVLSELTSNSKPIITDLTIIAGEKRKHGEGIANAICERIVEVPVEQKLPSLYLLDSIVKNIGREYVRYFSSRLAEVFFEAYRQVNPNLHPAMRHLFGTWSTIFPPPVLHKIEMQWQSSQSSGESSLRSSESPRPMHCIHVNPKYLRQFELQSAADSDNRHQRGTSAGLKLYGQKHSTGYEELYSDDTEVPSSHTSRVSRPFSPSRIGSDRLSSSEVDDLASYDSSRRLIERASPYHPGFDYGRGRAITRDEETREWKRKHFYDDYNNRSESFLNAYKLSNGQELQTPKALINAYGNDRGPGISNSNHVRTERLDVNGMGNKVTPRAWQNTEVEEYDWEDMSPTLADRKHSDFSLSSVTTFGSNRARPAGLESNSRSSPPAIIPSQTGVFPHLNNIKSHQPPTVHSNNSLQQHNWSQVDSVNRFNAVMNQGQNKYSCMPEAFGSFKRKEQILTRVPQSPDQRAALQQQSKFSATSLQLHFLPSAIGPLPPRLPVPSSNHGSTPQILSSVFSMVPSNPIPVAQPPLSIPNLPSGSLHLRGGAFPLFPPGPTSASQMMPATQNASTLLPNQPQGGEFSGLISSLMAQGLISLTKPTPIQDSVGLDFDADLLKLRHESAITALYAELQRQCTTCGLRFKFQEEHSAHMDWHVTRNRMSKSRKQKSSRKWFVSVSMWLSGADALGTDAVPGFLPTEDIVEKKDDKEFAVPADEDQSICALCGEPFDDFYSDETEEWMYRGAIYMNSPNGSFEGMDKSQLGPIVHAKCRTESHVVSPENFVQYDGGNSEDISQRKRLRRS